MESAPPEYARTKRFAAASSSSRPAVTCSISRSSVQAVFFGHLRLALMALRPHALPAPILRRQG